MAKFDIPWKPYYATIRILNCEYSDSFNPDNVDSDDAQNLFSWGAASTTKAVSEAWLVIDPNTALVISVLNKDGDMCKVFVERYTASKGKLLDRFKCNILYTDLMAMAGKSI